MEKKDGDLAELLGMFAADGCLQQKYACIWGNIYQDKDYYDKIVCPIFSKVFNKRIIAHEKRSNSVYGFYICGNEIINFFKKYGFNIGSKTYTVRVPKLILESNDFLLYASFIRGYTDCDGFVNFMKRKGTSSQFKKIFHTYPRIFIPSVSKTIIKDMSYMLDKLEINHSLEKRDTSNYEKSKFPVYVITLRGIKRLQKWMKIIGFNNSVQSTKYLIWKKYGFCPPNTTLIQRKEILKGKLNPRFLYNENGPEGI